MPLLAVLGAADPIVRVDESAAAFRDLVRPELLELCIVANGNHRFLSPTGEGFVPGDLDALSSFVGAQLG